MTDYRITIDVAAELGRLRVANAELIAALKAQIEPRARGWKVTDWDIRDEQARRALNKSPSTFTATHDPATGELL